MPEGPEIRRAADRLAKAVAGQPLQRVRLLMPHLAGREAELEGAQVDSITSRGKALLTRFSTGQVLYSHNQLYGRWTVCAPERVPSTGRSLRVALETEQRWALLYSASDVELLEEHQLEQHPFLTKLGPDLLDRTTTPAKIRRRLNSERFRGRALGGLLLDQGFLAGVGNYLRSEILFFAGLPPQARPKELDEAELNALAKAARSVTLRAYRTGGVTELPHYVKVGQAAGQRRRHWRHAVFGRQGSACRRCGTTIERLSVASRRLYWCPDCQPR